MADLIVITATIREVRFMDFEDFFDMDVFELAFALGMSEIMMDEELERIRIEREFEQDDDDNLFED